MTAAAVGPAGSNFKGPAPAAAGTSCGQTRTGVRVPVVTCQAYPAEKVLATGEASECHTGSAVAAALAGSSPSPSPSAAARD